MRPTLIPDATPNAASASRRLVYLALVCLSLGTLAAQEQNASASLPRGGLQILNVTGFEVYYSNGLPTNGLNSPAASANLPSDMGAGGSMTLNWSRFTDRSMWSITYTPSYTGRAQFSSLNAFTHLLSINSSKKIAPKWTLGVSFNGDLSTFQQSLFASNTLSNVTTLPVTFNDLASGLLAGKFGNAPLLGLALNGAPAVEPAAGNLLYGQRMLTASAQVSLGYTFSPRLSLNFSAGATRSQHLSDSQDGAGMNTISTPATSGAGATPYVVPDTTSGNANAGLSYSLSPTSQIGARVSYSQIGSPLQSSFTVTSVGTWGLTLRRKWLIQARAGLGVSVPGHSSVVFESSRPQPVVGGSLGYKVLSHTFLSSLDRSVADSYGLGSTSITSASAGWQWRRPRASWWLSSRLNSQRSTGSAAISNVSVVQWATSLNRSINEHVVLVTEYAFVYYGGGLQSKTYDLSQYALRASVIWIPRSVPLHR